MDSGPKKVFVSYVEEDGGVAHEIAKQLESHGYSSWYYERDCPAGADYFEETFKAISDCEAMAIIISPRSLPSDQITREIVRAVEANKATLPLLLDLTHDEYAHRRPGWKQAMAAANATRVRADQIPTIIPALVAGLHAKGIRADVESSTPPAPPAAVTRPAPDVAPTAPPSVRAVPPPAPSGCARHCHHRLEIQRGSPSVHAESEYDRRRQNLSSRHQSLCRERRAQRAAAVFH